MPAGRVQRSRLGEAATGLGVSKEVAPLSTEPLGMGVGWGLCSNQLCFMPELRIRTAED